MRNWQVESDEEQDQKVWRAKDFHFEISDPKYLRGRNLCGEAGGRAASDGLTGDMTSEHRVDRVKEAGFSSSNWSNEKYPSLGYGTNCGFVDLNTVHQLLPFPVEINRHKTFSSNDCLLIIFSLTDK